MQLSSKLIQFSLHKPKAVTAVMLLCTLIIGAFITQVHVVPIRKHAL